MKLRERLFPHAKGCTNGYCVVTGKASGMHTNSTCNCIVNMSRSQLMILQGRLMSVGELEVQDGDGGEVKQ